MDFWDEGGPGGMLREYLDESMYAFGGYPADIEECRGIVFVADIEDRTSGDEPKATLIDAGKLNAMHALAIELTASGEYDEAYEAFRELYPETDLAPDEEVRV